MFEQAPLGGGVGRFATVIIQMVAREIGKDRRIKMHCRHARLIQGVGGHLHGHGTRALVPQPGQPSLHGHRVQGGMGGRDEGIRIAVAQGAQQGGNARWMPQGLGQQVGATRLAVGAGDTDHPQVCRRLPEETPGQRAGMCPQVRHRHHRDGQFRQGLGPSRRIEGHGPGTVRGRVRGMVQAVA